MDHDAALVQMAEGYRQAGEWGRADRAFRRAIQRSPASAAVRVAYGSFLADREQFHSALAELMHGMDFAQETGDVNLQVLALSNLAVIYRQLGELDLARRLQRRVLALADEADSRDLLNWSADALLMGRTQVAESLAEAANDLAEQSDDSQARFDAVGMLGVLAGRKGELRRAVSLLIQAAKGHRTLGDHRSLATDYANLAEICGLMQRSKWQRWFQAAAAKFFQQAGMSLSARQSHRRLRQAQVTNIPSYLDPRWN